MSDWSGDLTPDTEARIADVVIVPPPEIDIATADLLARRIERARGLRPDRVVVDCGSVTFCDSTAISVLLSARRTLEAQGSALVIQNPSPPLQRVASVTGQAEVLGIPSQARRSVGPL